MNPIMLRVRHGLPFVFLALMYKHSDDNYYFDRIKAKKDFEKKVEEAYKGHPELFRD